MQGKCKKTYLVWEGLPKVTTYLKDEKGKGWGTSGEKTAFQVDTSTKNQPWGSARFVVGAM